MTPADRARAVLGGRRFIIDPLGDDGAEVLYDPPHEIATQLLDAGPDVSFVDFPGWTDGLHPGVQDGTRRPHARPITPTGPPRLIVRER